MDSKGNWFGVGGDRDSKKKQSRRKRKARVVPEELPPTINFGGWIGRIEERRSGENGTSTLNSELEDGDGDLGAVGGLGSNHGDEAWYLGIASPRVAAEWLDQQRSEVGDLLKNRNEAVTKFEKLPPYPDPIKGKKGAPRNVEAIPFKGLLGYLDNDDVDSDSSIASDGSGACDLFLGKRSAEEVAKREEERLRKMMGNVEATPFSQLLFDRAVKAKWRIMELKRLETLVREGVPAEIPKEFYDFGVELERTYGPMDRGLAHQKMLKKFKDTRLEMMAEMMETEKKLLEWVKREKNKRNAHSAEADGLKILEKSISEERKLLEETLEKLPEAKTDMNPYTSPARADFFVFPRKEHPLSTYVMRPKELDGHVEFTLDKDAKSYVREGYNPAVVDVGCAHADNAKGDLKRFDYFNGRFGTRALAAVTSRQPGIRIFNNWKKHLSEMSCMLMKYPSGIEAKLFFQRFREHRELFNSEPLFGDLSDAEGVKQVSEVFFAQKLGKGVAEKDILFHKLLDGTIQTPEVILSQTWKRIRFLLMQELVSELTSMGKDFKDFYEEPLYPLLDWGFINAEEFLDYSVTIFPEEMKDFTKIGRERADRLKKQKENNVVAAEASNTAGTGENINLDELFANLEFEDDGTWIEIEDSCGFSLFQ